MSTRWLFVLLALLLVALVATPASAGPGGSDRPFSAEYSGVAYWQFPGDNPPACDEVTTLSDATGVATHLGRVELASWHCPAEPGYLMDGYATIVAANGDELHLRYDYDPLDESNEIEVDVVGGTGRFEEASGSATWTYWLIPELIPGCNDPESFDCLDFTVPWQWWSSMEGRIDF